MVGGAADELWAECGVGAGKYAEQAAAAEVAQRSAELLAHRIRLNLFSPQVIGLCSRVSKRVGGGGEAALLQFVERSCGLVWRTARGPNLHQLLGEQRGAIGKARKPVREVLQPVVQPVVPAGARSSINAPTIAASGDWRLLRKAFLRKA